jgi:EmrB/QacA subfamily drug resistance transporter
MLLTLALGVFAGALDAGILSPALPALTRDFGAAPRDSAWVLTLYLVADVVAIPVMSKLSDVYGRRVIYSLCVAIFALGSALAIVAPTFAIFLAARAIQAIGAGGIFPVATAAIADRVPLERRGSALGLLGAVWGLAAIVGPNVGGAITHFLSWHWIFALNIPLAVVVIVLAQRTLPTAAARTRGPLDVAGIVALSVGLLGVMVGLSQLDTNGPILSSIVVASALVLAVCAFATLAAIERRAPEPVIAPDLFATRQLSVTYALEVVIGMLEASLFFIPAALVAALGLNAAAAGAIAAIGALVFVATIPLAGRALDAFGSRTVLMAGASTTAFGLALFAFDFTSMPVAVVAIAIAGVGFGALLGAPTRYIVSNEVPATRRATAVGLLSIFLIVGMIAGGSLAGGLIGSDIASVAGYRLAYSVFAALSALTAIAALTLKNQTAEARTGASQALSSNLTAG